MSLAIVVVAFAASVFTAWTIGANGAATAFGPVNSARAVNVFRGSLVVGVAALLGAVTQGGNVTSTMSGGLMTVELSPLVAAVVLVIAASLILFSILTQYPMPTVFTVVGGVLGAGIASGGAANIDQLRIIALFWLLIPFVAIGIGYVTARFLRAYVPNNERNKTYIRIVLFALGTYTAYTAGANQAGLAVGPLQNTVSLSLLALLLVGGLSMTLGAWMASPRIIAAVSRDYSKMGPRRAIAALLAASSLAQVATIFGIPVSFNESIISAIIGAGLVEGRSDIGKKKMFWTVVGWIGALIISFSLAYGVTRIILL